MRFRALIAAVLLSCVIGCAGGDSERFAPPQFVSIEAEVINGEGVLLRGTLSEGRAKACGFLYGADGNLDRRVEAKMRGKTFEVLISDADCDIVYSWCAWASSGTAEIMSDIGTFRIEPTHITDTPDMPDIPDTPVSPDDPDVPIVHYPPTDEIWYTTVTGKPMWDVSNLCVGCSVISNTYTDGLGVLRFDGTVSEFNKRALYGNAELESVILPSSVVSTSYSCFRQLVYLKSVIFAPGLVVLGDTSFHRNEMMTEILLPDTVVSIEKDALSHCYALKSIRLPSKLERLGQSAFLSCVNLESIVLPETMTFIGPYAFKDDIALRSITCLAPEPPIGSGQMFDNTTDCPIYVQINSIEAYRKAPYWSNYANRIQPIPPR